MLLFLLVKQKCQWRHETVSWASSDKKSLLKGIFNPNQPKENKHKEIFHFPQLPLKIYIYKIIPLVWYTMHYHRKLQFLQRHFRMFIKALKCWDVQRKRHKSVALGGQSECCKIEWYFIVSIRLWNLFEFVKRLKETWAVIVNEKPETKKRWIFFSTKRTKLINKIAV